MGGGPGWEEMLSSRALGSVGSEVTEHSRAGVGARALPHRCPRAGWALTCSCRPPQTSGALRCSARTSGTSARGAGW